MNSSAYCPALLIAAPASGQGKTTVVAATARYHQRLGRKVRVFKTGPDFIDPMIHERASGSPVYQLDLWMVGEDQSKQLLFEAAQEADLILIEGVMGLFDGEPSSADLAIRFGVPVAAVIDVSAMAQTFGALAHGLANYQTRDQVTAQSKIEFAGVIANRVASEGHGQMLESSISDPEQWLGQLPRSDDINLPERHLGLYQATDIDDLDARLNAAADLIANTRLSELPNPVAFSPCVKDMLEKSLTGQRIAVARDVAFSFVYRANLDLLKAMGAELLFFSPLEDTSLPVADSLYLPGGYPELYLDQLSANKTLHREIQQHYQSGKPMVAECGGMLYLLESLADREGNTAGMVGIIPASARMQKRLGGLGLQSASLSEGSLRGHTFHYSTFDSPPEFAGHAQHHRYDKPGEGIIRSKGLLAAYVHWYFPSNPEVAAKLFCRKIIDSSKNDQSEIDC
jgi:cobyrinic acid a,c-diamide synthase